jgi:hypothetical protein
MNGRGTRFNANGVIAIREGMLGDNIISRIEEELNPSAVTIDKRLAEATRAIEKIRAESAQIQRLAAERLAYGKALLRAGQDSAAAAVMKEQLMLENRFKQYSDMIVAMEAAKGKAFLAKTVEKVSESMRLIENVLGTFNASTDSTTAENTMTDIDHKSKKVDGDTDIYGQAATDDQRDAERDVEAAIETLKEQLADEVALALPKVGANALTSSVAAERASTANRHHQRASSPVLLEAEYEGGGTATQAQRQQRPKHGNNNNTHRHHKRPPPPSTPPPPSSHHGPRPPPPSLPPLTTSSIRPRSANELTEEELEAILPTVSNHRPPSPPSTPPPDSGSVSPSTASRSPPPFSLSDRRTGGGERDHGRKTTPSPRQRIQGLHDAEPALSSDNSRDASNSDDSDEEPLKRKTKRSKRKEKHKRASSHGKSEPASTPQELPDIFNALIGNRTVNADDDLDDYLLFD